MDPIIILVNGPSSSGKSTLAKNLQARIVKASGDLYEVISIDDFMKCDPEETIYEDDVYEISGEMCDAIKDLMSKGTGVIVDHVITSERIYEQLLEETKPYDLRTVKIECAIEILRQREQARGDRCVGSAESSLTYLYPKDGYDLTVNTGDMSSEDCAAKIYEAVFVK